MEALSHLGRYAQPLAAFGLLFGLLQCFFGFRLLRLVLIIGGILGGFLAAFVGASLSGCSPQLCLYYAVAAGLLLAILFGALKPLGLFIYALSVYFSFSLLIGQFIQVKFVHEDSTDPILILSIAVAIGGGIGTLAGGRPAKIFVTAAGGAGAIVNAFGVLGDRNAGQLIANPGALLIATGAIALVGVAFQSATTSGMPVSSKEAAGEKDKNEPTPVKEAAESKERV